MNEIPVYMFTGFLEAGKTTMLQQALSDSEFCRDERTLLLLCEEGIEEYDPTEFASKEVYLETVEEEEDLSPELFLTLAEKYNCTRIIVEYNGMWQMNSIFRALPENFLVFQEIFVADSSTILNYNANMRALVVDKLQSCDLTVFNRVTDGTDLMPLHKLVRGISRRCDIEYNYTDGRAEADTIEDPLPFDINADVIEIADGDYALWYQDLMEDMLKYDTKTVRFKGIVAIDGNFPPRTMAIGRHVMTCCADDIQYAGLICKYKKADTLRARDWVTITAKVSVEFHKLYGKEGPVLVVTQCRYDQKPEQEVVSVY